VWFIPRGSPFVFVQPRHKGPARNPRHDNGTKNMVKKNYNNNNKTTKQKRGDRRGHAYDASRPTVWLFQHNATKRCANISNRIIVFTRLRVPACVFRNARSCSNTNSFALDCVVGVRASSPYDCCFRRNTKRRRVCVCENKIKSKKIKTDRRYTIFTGLQGKSAGRFETRREFSSPAPFKRHTIESTPPFRKRGSRANNVHESRTPCPIRSISFLTRPDHGYMVIFETTACPNHRRCTCRTCTKCP